MKRTDIAHHEWDRRWKTSEGRSDWIEPESEVRALIPMLHERKLHDVMDLGCGVGRHAILLAESGFAVTAIDGSASGIEYVREMAESRGLPIHTLCAEMVDVPVGSDAFDYLLAWNVIYHGDLGIVRQAIAEIYRVLRVGGLAQLTMLTDQNHEILTGTYISEGTYINPGMSDKDHPHFYCDSETLVELFRDFKILKKEEKEHKRPGSFHWHLLVEKPA